MSFDLSKLYSYIVDGFNSLLQFILDVINWAFDQALIPLLHTLASWVGQLSPPCCVDRIPGIVDNFVGLASYLGGGLGWFLGMIDLGFGVQVIMCVLIARFVLRRIPLIG